MKIVNRLFDKKEILRTEKFFIYEKKYKIIVFIPESYTDKIIREMGSAGAGRIGNYKFCSFRSSGTGTFIPGKKAKPFSGKKNKLSEEKEFKIEMECEKSKLDAVINVLLQHHPYEEVAYEIHPFLKRNKDADGLLVELKTKKSLYNVFKKLNETPDKEIIDTKNNFKKIILTESEMNEDTFESAKLFEAEYLLQVSNKNINIYKI